MLSPTKTRQLQLETAGFALTDTRFGAGFVRARHTHEKAEFCFVFEGRFDETFGAHTVSARALETSFKPAGVAHSTSVGAHGARCLVLEIPPTRDLPVERPVLFRAGVATELGARMLEEMEIGDDLSRPALEGLALELIGQAGRIDRTRTDRSPRWLGELDELLHEPAAHRLTVTRIAAAIGIDPGHLSEVFRRHRGCTVGQYVRRLRLARARRALARSDRSIAEVALEAGFCDQGHLTRAFKRLTGTTPARYRLRASAADRA